MKFVMGKHYHNVSLFVDGKDLAETELTALAKQYDRNGIPRITGSDLDKLLRQYTVCDGSPYKRTAVLDGVDMAKYGITGTLDTAHPVTVERTCLPLSEGLPVDMYAIITEHRDGYRNDVDLAKEVAYEHILPESMPAG